MTPPKSYSDFLYASVKSSNLSPSTQSWLTRVLYALDQKDITTYCGFLTDDASVTFNNGEQGKPNMTGIETVRNGLGAYWQSFKSIQHEEIVLTEIGMTVMHEALNHYETLDGRKVTLRGVAILERREDGKIEAVRLYSDQALLWKA